MQVASVKDHVEKAKKGMLKVPAFIPDLQRQTSEEVTYTCAMLLLLMRARACVSLLFVHVVVRSSLLPRLSKHRSSLTGIELVLTPNCARLSRNGQKVQL